VEANVVLEYLKGLMSGAVLVTAGLAVMSQSTLPPGMAPAEARLETEAADVVTEAGAAQAGAEAGHAGSDATDEAPVGTAEAPTTAQEPARLDGQQTAQDEPLLRPMTEPKAPPAAAIVPDLQTNAAVAPPDQPVSDAAPAAQSAAPTEPAASEPTPQPVPEAGSQVTDVAEPAAEPATVPAISAETTEDKATGAQDAESASLAQAELAPAPSTLSPDGGLEQNTVDGVTTGRLPTITADPAAEISVAIDATSPAEPSVAGTDLPEIAGDLPPLQRFARSFENPSAKPLFAILLLDPGGPEVRRAELAALPLPLSFVVDPMQPGAVEAAAIYRAAGQEVVMLATAIPKGAKAADLEQSFAAIAQILPEAVALIDTADATFQDDRGLSAEVVTHLDDKGLGLVTFDRGLNAADQVARREAVPAATVFRSLDDEGEDSPLIRRYLDRAAFKAAQEGRVVVIGTAREATITALMEWAVEGRSASVALAPISAVMQAP
jgi:polysaccharide deacetylase 2 family uncharacterized protein YibQ